MIYLYLDRDMSDLDRDLSDLSDVRRYRVPEVRRHVLGGVLTLP